MPGALLDLDLPLDADPVSVAIPKVTECLQTIQADLEPRVVPSEIDINDDLDFQGFGAIGLGFTEFENATDTDDYNAGSVIYLDGDFYLITASGAVRVTELGSLSGTGTRGFVGDYGVGGNPAAATYVDSAGSFQFTEEPSVWADIECDDLILHGTSTKTTLSSLAGLAGDQTLIFGDCIPASSRHILLVDSSGNVVCSDGVSISGNQVFGGDITTTTPRNIKHSGVGYHTEPAREQPASAQDWVTGGATVVGVTLSASSTEPFSYRFGQCEYGDRVDSITFGAQGGAAGDDITSINVYIHKLDGTVTNLNPSPTSYSNIGTAYLQRVVSIDATTLDDGDTIFFGMVVNGTVPGILMGPARLRKTRP